ncbi:hypothetical protein U1Q18_016039, partial [Sarracenia purpurea var. burkii]
MLNCRVFPARSIISLYGSGEQGKSLRLVAQLKKARVWRKGMPWRKPPHFSTTRRTRAGETDSDAAAAAEVLEKSMERVGMVKLGHGRVGLGFGQGFLRWCSLIRANNLSATRVSDGDNSRLGVGVLSSFAT